MMPSLARYSDPQTEVQEDYIPKSLVQGPFRGVLLIMNNRVFHSRQRTNNRPLKAIRGKAEHSRREKISCGTSMLK